MRDWFGNLAVRERRVLVLGAVVLAGLILYLAVWEPLASDHRAAQEVVQARRALVQWLRGAAAEARALGAGQGAASVPSARQSLLATIDATLDKAQMKGAIKRVEPDGASRVRVWVDGANFDRLLRWIGQLAGRHGIEVLDLRVERTELPGRVSGRMTFGRREA